MNSPAKKIGDLYSIFQDFVNPSSFWGRNIFDSDEDFSPVRLGINLPTANISEGPEEFKLELAAPGLHGKDFIVEIENRVLKISAKKQEEKNKEKQGRYFRKEYSFNSFERRFFLPQNIKEDSIEAIYDNGILKIFIPKLEKTDTRPLRKISVS